MRKLKKIWEENKVLFVLGIILVVCLVIVGTVSIVYFYGSSKDVYGNRLDITKKVPLRDNVLKDIDSKLESNEAVNSASVNLKGKIIYVIINFNDDTSMDGAKAIAAETVSILNEQELNVYDLEYTIENSHFTLMGARNTNGNSDVVWSNYTKTQKEE